VIAADQQRLAAVQARYQRGQATEAEVQQERGRIWSNRTVVEKATAGAKDQYHLFERAHQQIAKSRPAAPPLRTLSSEINTYRQTLDALDRVAANMVKA
jgi:outer membrane protein TolC